MDFTKTFRIEYERKYLNVPDGGQICIDITPPLRDIPPDRRPILVCAHGLTGGSHESVHPLPVCMLPVAKGSFSISGLY